jgi:hypothetical protein
MTARLALQLNAVIGLMSSAVAGAIIWLVLTQPVQVAVAVATHDYVAIAAVVGRQLGSWLGTLLWFV